MSHMNCKEKKTKAGRYWGIPMKMAYLVNYRLQLGVFSPRPLLILLYNLRIATK
jgi:hypothetical protein